jgi:hypothetical protein
LRSSVTRDLTVFAGTCKTVKAALTNHAGFFIKRQMFADQDTNLICRLYQLTNRCSGLRVSLPHPTLKGGFSLDDAVSTIEVGQLTNV